MSKRRFIALLVAAGALFGGLAEAAAENNAAEKGKVIHYTVNPGDTLGSIALQFGVDYDDVRAWNELEGLTVEPGQELIVKSDKKPKKKRSRPLPVVHRIRRGDTFEGIAKKYGVSVRKVRRWNRRLNPRRLQIGQRVRLYIPGRDGKSVSWGSANRGRLYNGIALEDSEGLNVRHVSRAYGTKRTIQLLRAAAADVKARWPDAPEMVVGDLSYKRGGRIRGHSSHQSGRDADVSYYYRGNVQLPNLFAMSYEQIDAVKTWHLFKTLIDTGEVEYIFVERDLQRALYEYARSIGYSKEALAPILQYPRPNHEREGIIRHVSGHDTHFHIRFKCGPDDRNCD
ncbi:LysM peptidoglycan-binding domain-containing protein [Persicimonas caeni]|uniref:LysM peptidoglycan-binding domain-containing protein n=1 Tax=Persicimonas caeni TaxID=2292766 RepID=A0A4Y6Q339_PERCE|nr:penicillin-insensitive murein endopeptidase [Persicimonas caeni]QDG54425.1 LysM peptidoglycan-binding domain-containing protein [Persicimonas caeni]QED35646.1 LysM peptidoglycan-binding domain-containing protein [Persicimonas caeni]